MAFKGWPVEAIEFFEGLEADNTKTYWTEHKAIFDTAVKAPFDALFEEIGGGKLFRPYRDVRFSKDKTPYKTWAAAHLDRGGYVQLSPEGLFVGTGYYGMMPDQTARMRAAIDTEAGGASLEQVVAATRKAGLEVNGEQLKTAPKGYPKDHPRIELLRYKSMYAGKTYPVAAWLGTAKAKDRILDVLEKAKPLNAWLDANVGPTTTPYEGRR